MDRDKKLEMLKELDSTTDWEALILEKERKGNISQAGSQKRGGTSSRKLTKGEKKRLKKEKKLEQVQKTIEEKNVPTVVYNNPDSIAAKLERATRRNKREAEAMEVEEEGGPELDMKQARHEIVKFGMTGLKSQNLKDAEESLAISLGAQPNKRKGINYKELQAERKKDKEVTAMEQDISMLKPNLKVSMKNTKGKRPPGANKGRSGAGGGATRRKDKIEGSGKKGRGFGRGNNKKRSRRN